MVDLFKIILWDHPLTDDEILSIWRGELVKGGMDELSLKARLLNSYNWYILIRELGIEEAQQLLKPEIIERLYPSSLRRSYHYAASVLHERQLHRVVQQATWINDVSYRKSDPIATDLFHQTDTIENIGSNKLCALSRNEPKDIADILYIEQMFTPHWPSMVDDAKKKELSVNEVEVAAHIGMYPVDLLRSVRWITEPNYETFPDQLRTIAEKILRPEETMYNQ